MPTYREVKKLVARSIPVYQPGDKLVFGEKPGTTVYTEVTEREEIPECRVPKPGYVLTETIHASQFHTQGFGQNRYTKGYSEVRLAGYRAAGFYAYSTEESHVHRVPVDSWRQPGVTRNEVATDVHVFVRADGPVSPINGLALAESVRLLWEKGCNPRVVFPFLPYGFEEQNGFDYFGKRTRAA